MLRSLVAPVIIFAASTCTASSCFFVSVEQLSHAVRIFKHRSDKGYVHALEGRVFYFKLYASRQIQSCPSFASYVLDMLRPCASLGESETLMFVGIYFCQLHIIHE